MADAMLLSATGWDGALDMILNLRNFPAGDQERAGAFSQRASPSGVERCFDFSMLNHVTAEYCRAWLAGLTSLAIAPRRVSGLRLSPGSAPPGSAISSDSELWLGL